MDANQDKNPRQVLLLSELSIEQQLGPQNRSRLSDYLLGAVTLHVNASEQPQHKHAAERTLVATSSGDVGPGALLLSLFTGKIWKRCTSGTPWKLNRVCSTFLPSDRKGFLRV